MTAQSARAFGPRGLLGRAWSSSRPVTFVGATMLLVLAVSLTGLLLDPRVITGWSTTGGDLRVPHFVGLHGLQTLPLFGYLLALVAPAWLRTSYRVVLVWTAGLSYLCLIGLLTWQALGGQPVISPDARMLVALVALVLTAGTAASAVVLGAWRG